MEEDTGASLANRMLEQCKKFGAELVKDEVLDLDLQNDIVTAKEYEEAFKKWQQEKIETNAKYQKELEKHVK